MSSLTSRCLNLPSKGLRRSTGRFVNKVSRLNWLPINDYWFHHYSAGAIVLNALTVVAGSVLVLILANGATTAHAVEQRLQTGSAEITLAWDKSHWPTSAPAILSWIQSSLDAVTAYFGEFPVNNLHLALSPSSGRSINGTAYPGTPPVIIMRLGILVRPADLQQDWVLVHELTHLSLPPLERRHHWLEEGVATYMEPMIRYHSGLLSEDELWRWLLLGTPKGLPKSDDQGLDFTPSWGRTYWGGALFCLLADLQIREQTAGRYGFGHALRAIGNAGGTMENEKRWPISEVFAIGDRATGTQVLQELYAQHRAQAITPALAELWQRLGVALVDGAIVYDDKAPRSKLRKALTSAP